MVKVAKKDTLKPKNIQVQAPAGDVAAKKKEKPKDQTSASKPLNKKPPTTIPNAPGGKKFSEQGIAEMIDAGASTMAWMSGLPRVAIHDIAIQERENEIVLGTHGRSIYIGSLTEVQKLAMDKAYFEKKKSELK